MSIGGRPPKPHLVRGSGNFEGHSTKSAGRMGPEHPSAMPEKPTYLSSEAEVFWEEYCKFSAPGLLRLVHAPALAQLCEDNALSYRLRRAISMHEEVLLRQAERAREQAEIAGVPIDPRDSLPGGSLGVLVETEEGSRLLRVLNQVVLRVQKQEQQFGLTPAGATRVDIAGVEDKDNSFEDELCG